MDLLDSQWFFRLVEKCGKTPAERLVAVFDIVENLIEAPDIREKLLREPTGGRHCLYLLQDLKTFLTDLALAAKAKNPPFLANQLVMLLQGAIAIELRNPGTRALHEAARAAHVVVAYSCHQPMHQKLALVSAGGVVAALVASIIGWQAMQQTSTLHSPQAGNFVVAQRTSPAIPTGVSPDEMEQILMLHEQIEKGICRAPHMAVLPPGQMTAYMNVIEFRTPENPAADRAKMLAFLTWFEKVRSGECYDPPANGHTAVTWTKG